MERAIQERDISRTFAKGLEVLRVFDARHTKLTLADMARITGYDRATVRRLMLTLVDLGYVKQDGKSFSLTPRILVLAGGFLEGRSFGKTIVPIIKSASREIGGPVSMAMKDGFEAVYVAHAGIDETMISHGFTIGSRIPLLTTAMGRALLAFADPCDAAHLIKTAPLVAHTAETAMERCLIKERIDLARINGYAFADGEFEAGVAALAVPVGTLNNVAAAVGVAAPRARLADLTDRDRIAHQLRACALQLANALR